MPTTAGDPADTLIVSDLHLGLRGARADDLLAVLARRRFQRLILLGDLFHDFSFARFSADTWTLLRYLRRLGSHRAPGELVCVLGNHDRHLADPIARLIGVEVCESYAWTCEGQRCLALHGDRFDRFITNNPRISTWVSKAYAFCERRLSRDGTWPERLDRMHARGLSERVAEQALAFGRAEAADVVICGHTHEPLLRTAGGVAYVNTGAWVGRPGSFVTIGPAGIRLHAHP